jgi:hypothetical protein
VDCEGSLEQDTPYQYLIIDIEFVAESDIFEAKKRFPDSGKVCVLNRKVSKIRFLRLFASIHRPPLNQGSVFSSFPEEIFENFSRVVAPTVRD